MRFLIAFGLMSLALSLAGSAWWLNRPAVEPGAGREADDADIYCTGRVDAPGGVAGLDPAQPGRTVAVLVAEGDAVRKDQPILKLDPAVADARLAQADAAVEAAQIELDTAKRDKERFPNQIAARTHLANAAAARVEGARKLLQQRREQVKVTPLGKAEEEAMRAQIRELELMEAAQRGELDDLKKLDLDLRIRAAQIKLRSAVTDRQLAQKSVDECTLTAPGDGLILRLHAAVGSTLAPGSPVPPVVFAPAGPLVIRAEVDQEHLGRIGPGMRVEAQDENRLGGTVWKGTVAAVGRWVAQRRTFVLEPGELNDVRTVECVIALESPADRLWIGQRMRVRIVHEPKPVSRQPGAAR